MIRRTTAHEALLCATSISGLRPAAADSIAGPPHNAQEAGGGRGKGRRSCDKLSQLAMVATLSVSGVHRERRSRGANKACAVATAVEPRVPS